MAKLQKVSVFQIATMITSVVLGLIVGSSFIWAAPGRAWDNLIAGFLWVMLVAVAMGLAQFFVRERLRRDQWWRGIGLGCEMTFPATTLYMLLVALASASAAETTAGAGGTLVLSRPDMLALAPLFYGVTLAVAIFIGPVCVWTSPFGMHKPAPTVEPVSEQ
jgi:hypothetical protein